jgi:hypothetical protein
VSAPLTNSGTESAASLGLNYGAGLGVYQGALIVFGVSQSSVTGLTDALALKAAAVHSHGSITSSGAIGSTSGRIVVTGASGVLTTATTISAATQVSGLATVATSGSASDLGSGTIPVARLPLATTTTAGAIIVGSGLSVASGTVSAAVTSVAGRTGAITLTTSDVSGLGTLATQSGTFSGTSSGTNTGDQTITLTGDVTGSGTGSFAATLSATGVTAGTYTSVTVDAKGRVTAGSSPAVAYSSLSGIPSTFAPSAHTHPLSDLSQSGATTNQVPQWNGSAWVPATVSGGGGGGSTTDASQLTSGTLNDARLSFVPLHPFLLMGG